MLTVDGGLLFWTIVTFLILLVVLKKIAWGPIITALESREKEIKEAMKELENKFSITLKYFYSNT